MPDNTHTQAHITYMHLHARIKGICFKGRDVKREQKKHSIYSSRFIFFLSGAQWGQAPIFFHPHVNHESLFLQYTNHVVQIIKRATTPRTLEVCRTSNIKAQKTAEIFLTQQLEFYCHVVLVYSTDAEKDVGQFRFIVYDHYKHAVFLDWSLLIV